MLEQGDIITLDANGKEYLVVKEITKNQQQYYYLMTTQKPVEVLIVKLNEISGTLESITDNEEINEILQIVNN